MENLSKNLKFIPGQNRGRYPFCHSLYLDDDVKVLVDPSSDGDIMKKLADGNAVDVILLTHFHEDHWMYRHLFPDAEVCIHENEAASMESLENLFDYYGIPLDSAEGRHFVGQLEEIYHFVPNPADRSLKDGDVLQFGSTHVEVVHTPGHSAGHCAYYFREQDALFMGDYDLTRFGPWYGDRLADIDRFIESAGRLRQHPAKLKVTAHDMGVVNGDAERLWDRYLAVIDRRQAKLEEALKKKPMTMAEIVELGLIYGRLRKKHEFMDLAERVNIAKHLDRMIAKGQAEMDGDRYVLRT